MFFVNCVNYIYVLIKNWLERIVARSLIIRREYWWSDTYGYPDDKYGCLSGNLVYPAFKW